jgi:hypothetical protein
MDGEQAERSAKRRRCSDGGGDGDLGNDADCLQYDACGSEFGSEYFDGSACSDGDSSPAGSSEDDSGSAAAQCLGQPQEQAACFEQAMTADTSERLEPTHPQPTEVSEGLCPASHRRQYYSDDFAGGGGY